MHIVVSPTPAAHAAARIAYRLRDAARRRESALLALSGGGTAPAMIDALIADDVPWAAVSVWQVDERIAPDGHEARNASQLAALDALPCQIHPMPVTASDLSAAAAEYARSLPDRFDVVHLGVGDDGHTASWPPGEPEVRDSNRTVELTGEFNGWSRMTLTRRVVNGARSRVVLVTGSAKRPVIERWLLDDGALPVTAVRSTSTNVYLDPAAAPY